MATKKPLRTSKKAKATVSKQKPFFGFALPPRIKTDLLALALIAGGALCLTALLTDTVGFVGNLLRQAMLFTCGRGSYLIPLLLFLTGYLLTRQPLETNSPDRLLLPILGVAILTVNALTLIQLITASNTLQLPDTIHNEQGGGIIGGLTAWVLLKSFGIAGSYIIIIAASLAAMLLLASRPISQLLMAGRNRLPQPRLSFSQIIDFFFTEAEDEATRNQKPVRLHHESKNSPVRALHVTGDSNPSTRQETFTPVKNEIPKEKQDREPPSQPVSLSDGRPYRLPPLSLLGTPPVPANSMNDTELTRRTKILEETLESFGIPAKVSEICVGPAITRYEIQPPPGVKVSRIVGLSDDIALSLAAPGVRIEAPIPGKAAVGIEVPNPEITPVHLRDLLESREFTHPSSRLTVALGRDIAGTPVVADLGKMPHLLVAGATGSGKSVCINTLIASILFRATPDEVKFLMIDPKMVELATYNGIPHLISPVVTDPKKAAGTLRWAVKEMERRYELFAHCGVRDIARYNQVNQTALPYIIVLIDELADLMMVAPADVEDSICRLAQMARAAGIHLVIATQRPSVDIITGLIKANIPSRISFAVSSQTDSRTILDMGGAEKLLGKGDMLFFPVGAPKPIRVQGAYLSDSDVEALVKYLKEQAQPVYDEQVLKAPPAEGKKAVADEYEDELLPQAVKIFIESGTASISLLQRRLHIGYARAARLVDIMEQKGIVGGFEGSKPRAILMSMEQYRQTFPEN
ncbi:FtsK/SpoIIIE family DNA translocase [Desulfurispora thermophila]|uniref:FtsK/SpoIIIE family DNA translocase n=1 Tax=Desulfurispora thermophila TaxID=265470 RepID=UPI0003792630|nr:DNA translocase FtsK [Desulfurispora thermophila]